MKLLRAEIKPKKMANPVLWGIEQIKRLNHFIWHTPLSEISKGWTFLFKQLKIILFAARSFTNDKIQLRASALTFYSLLSIIPIAAIAFAIAKGFAFDEKLEQLIIEKFKDQKEVIDWLLNNVHSVIRNTNSLYVGGVGVIVLFWSALSLLDRIESSFNYIWQVKVSRPWYRKFTDYITIMLIAPVLIILSSRIKVFIGAELEEYLVDLQILDFLKPVIAMLVKFMPYIISWSILTILFIIMPNAKVKIGPAVISGIVAGTVIQILQWLYIDMQFGHNKLNAIYLSLAAFPLLLLLLQSSWLVILLGAELCFANQNFSHYELEPIALNISQYQKRAVMLLILNMIVRNFELGERPVSAETIAHTLKIPVRLARDILQDLTNARLISILHENEHKERLYQPALDINRMTVSYVLSQLDKKGISNVVVSKTKDYGKVIAILDKFEKQIAKSSANILIKDL